MLKCETRYFDPAEIVRGIQQLLVSDKKKIAFLFGAGTSFAPKAKSADYVPAIGKMTEEVVDALLTDAVNGEKYKIALAEIDKELEQQGQCLNVETLLSNIEEKTKIIGNGTLNGLTKCDFIKVGDDVRKKIQELVSVHNKEKLSFPLHYDFAKWICNADRKFGVEIFTTNYDYLFELGLEANAVPYYDGFTGSYKPFFNSDALEDLDYLPRQTKLWKIHGSLGLHKDVVSGRIIRVGSDSDDLLIYPSSLKYKDSKKQPYSAFMDRINLFLKQDDAVLFVCGYSFGDEHINERLLSALQTNTTAHVFVLYYDIVWSKDENAVAEFSVDCVLGKLASRNRKISVLSTRAAIIGGQFGKWKIRPDIDKDDPLSPASYFKYDVEVDKSTDPKTGVEHQEQVIHNTGELLLPSFDSFVELLKNMIPKNEWEEKGGE